MSKVRYFVNNKTRMCQMLTGPENGADHLANIAAAFKEGFAEVADADELEAFRAVTQQAKEAGWNPNRMRYDTWLRKREGV